MKASGVSLVSFSDEVLPPLQAVTNTSAMISMESLVIYIDFDPKYRAGQRFQTIVGFFVY